MKVDFNERQSDVQIEILPMIDVIFCILTFFILAAVGLTRQQAIELDLPTVNNSAPLQDTAQDRLFVSVDSVGQVYVDKDAVPLGLLYDVLVQHQKIAPNGMIVLYASRSARYEDVVKVLDLLRSVGGDRVALATLPNDVSLDPTQNSGETVEETLIRQGIDIPSQTGIPPQGAPDGVQILPVPADGQPNFPNTLPPISPSPTTPGTAPGASGDTLMPGSRQILPGAPDSP
ncbi:MAG: biopolymer transporter ExbD [Leptolyngbya foveolarum]|uniref:Biopolymer transporter ExbD n=1 Tax=Leptolyngbya foveolarum TaxID=47253 RepID=A0A2W4TZJ4_9CYAN|nr:MAG: biopolymer transporter ExbD [Leptolyngbya foveolarum]